MKRDMRTSDIFHEARRIFEQVYRPAENFVSDIADIQLSTDVTRVLFTGTVVEDLDQPASTRICEYDLVEDSIRIVTSGPN